MSIKRYSLIDHLCAVAVLVIALTTYILTLEPTVSYWDCPEYVIVADRLDIGHPPGNPFWMLAARFVINFAPDIQSKAQMVNAMSGLLSALTIMMLYLTVSMMCRRALSGLRNQSLSLAKALMCWGSGLTAALLYAWSDTFWFSAVEAEVYAFSSFLTALTLWLALKWLPHAQDPSADKWLILIAYIIGIGIGVHELNLLILPVVALITAMGLSQQLNVSRTIFAIIIGLAMVALVLYGLIPGFIKLASWIELLCVNTFGMKFNSGLFICWCLVAGFLICACVATWRAHTSKIVRYLRLASWSLAMLFLGVSSYAVIIIRAAADPPMNQNTPDNIFDFNRYFTREQYGKAPLIYGQTFNSRRLREAQQSITREGDTIWHATRYSLKNPIPQYVKNTIAKDAPLRNGFATASDSALACEALQTSENRYFIRDYSFKSRTTPELDTWFPRLYSSAQSDIDSYAGWAGLTPGSLDTVFNPTTAIDNQGNRVDIPSLREPYLLKPTVRQNLQYFVTYQLAYMYGRYFLWNFVGRQNNYTGHGEPDAGNFITGLDFLDRAMLDAAYMEPGGEGKSNPGRNVYWFIPLLLGICGVIWLCNSGREGRREALVIFLLFVMTGVAITVYLNQTPVQARERDYAFSGSFYAFAIFIGLGINLLQTLFLRMSHRKKPVLCASFAIAIGIASSLQVLSQTYDDHNRSGRTATRDIACNILNTLEPDAILFVTGDNYTFPLWYAQEVERVRPDVRIINLSYLSTPWYASQLPRSRVSAVSVPLTATSSALASGRYSFVSVGASDTIPRDAVASLKAMFESRPDAHTGGQPRINASRLRVANLPGDTVSYLDIDLMKIGGASKAISLSDLMIIDVIATNAERGWRRPVYWLDNATSPLGGQLSRHFTRVGPLYRLTPGKNNVDLEKVLSLVTDTYRWGGADATPIPYFDPVSAECVSGFRRSLITTAAVMARRGIETHDSVLLERAFRLAQKINHHLPPSAVPWSPYFSTVPDRRFTDEGAELAAMYAEIAIARSDTTLFRHAIDLLSSRVEYARAHQRRADALRPEYRKYLSFRSLRFIQARPDMEHLLDSLKNLSAK